MRLLVALSLLISTAWAGLPPTTSKDSADLSNITTFFYQFPNFTGTHTGVTFSLGVNSIAGGGTGQTTALAGFDALSPLTTAGDILYENATPVGARLPIGAVGQVLTVNAGATAPQWTSISAIGISTDWTSCDTLTVGATVTPPTKGGSTVDQCRYRRVGDSMQFQYTYVQTSGGAAGSGQYLFPIPAGLTADTTKITAGTVNGTIVTTGGATNTADFTNNDSDILQCYLYDSTHLGCRVQQAADTFVLFGSASNVTFGNGNTRFSFQATIPISGWSSNTIGGVGGYMPLSTGDLTTIGANEIVGSGLTSAAEIIKTIVAQAAVFTCSVNPTLTLYDCGTTSSSCSTGTAIGSVTLTASNTPVTGSFTAYSLPISHYWAWLLTAGTCTALNASGTAGF